MVSRKFRKGMETYDVVSKMKEVIEKELRLQGFEDNMNQLTNKIKISIDIDYD